MTATAQPEIRKGLAGVVADTTAISSVIPETNSLTYRGYAVQDLTARCSFEEVAYLIWNGDLPGPGQLAAFTGRERAQCEVTRSTIAIIDRLPDTASTFTARTVASTLSDIYSAVTAAVGALKGPLHGGANEAVMHMMLEIGDPTRAAGWLHEQLADGRKVMGFGHRVYKDGDSRVPTMKDAFLTTARLTGGQRWAGRYDALEQAMLTEKGIKPNLHFPSGPAYYLMGFDIPHVHPPVRHVPHHRLDRPRHRAVVRQQPHPPAQRLRRPRPAARPARCGSAGNLTLGGHRTRTGPAGCRLLARLNR